MTAMNLIVQARARAAFLLTDTASIWSRSGKVAHFGSKVIPVYIDGRAVAAVAVSGRLEPSDLAERMDEISPQSLSGFLEEFPEVFRATERALKKRDAAGSMAAVIAAFDHERSRPIGYRIANDNLLFPPGYRPYELKQTSRHLTEFNPDNVTLLQSDFCDPRHWEPDRDAEKLIEAQRRDPDILHGRHSIGGEAVLTRVDASGVCSKVLKAWPDRVGRRINPEASVRSTTLGSRLAEIASKWDTARQIFNAAVGRVLG
ncbi:hypothetical protein KK137_06335 [Croceibacterium sp. LX-88]|uniref:Uncharacterized protein n=1 Tax=Croceibacterium selenioxidans TaxID=2838833 RepID=A0ABS5W4E0_9SPHN|nr:hypothetical protein [Croceibacterium selenioxidans]MBT2133947.1 hypothetical protein [Croceibacterium selenioxidans]